MERRTQREGFTLIELSIVLVIIGLIVGGVLVGRDLVRASEVRATISQIEKYNTAANTFRGKYGYLPGDIKDPDASRFGFLARGALAGVPVGGTGDGNGLIEGTYNPSCTTCTGGVYQEGEGYVFWVDLSTAALIEGRFNKATATNVPTGAEQTAMNNWLPEAKLGNGNYIYAWSENATNYYGISAVWTMAGNIRSNAGMTPSQAFNMDSKVDDGLPQSGRVIARYVPISVAYWAMFSYSQYGYGGPAPGAAASKSSVSCYDNGNAAGVITKYTISNTTLNCALSFGFQ